MRCAASASATAGCCACLTSYAIPLAIINLFIVGYLEPYTDYRYEGLRFDLNSGALGAAIKVGEFNQLGKHLTLRIDRSENKGTQLHGHLRPERRRQGHDASPRPPSMAVSLPPTIPTRSCSA